MVQVTNDNFNDVITSKELVVIKFGAEWCGPCKAMKPTLNQLEEEGNVVVGDVNADVESELCQKFKIRSIPAMFYFKNGVQVDSTVGTQTLTQIKEILARG